MNFFILFSVLSTQYFRCCSFNSSQVKTAMLEWSLECIQIEEYRKMKMIALVDSNYFPEWFDVNTLRVSNGVCGAFLDQIMIMIIYFSM